MDQASADVQAETQRLQNQKNNENRPKHSYAHLRAPNVKSHPTVRERAASRVRNNSANNL